MTSVLLDVDGDERRVERLDDDALVARFRAVEVLRRALEAELAVVAGEVERRQLHRQDGHMSISGWLRAVAGWSTRDCIRLKRRSRLFVLAPPVRHAMEAGAIGVAQVDEMARAAANPRCGSGIVDFVPIFLRDAERLSFGEFTVVVRTWENLADADGAHRERDAAVSRRRARVGVSGKIGFLRAEGGALAGAEILEVFEQYLQAEVLTDRAEADRLGSTLLPRTDAQRRYDALHAIFLAAASTPADAQRPEPLVSIGVDHVTFETHLARKRLAALRPDLPRLSVDLWRCHTTNGIALTPEDAFQAAIAGHVRRVVFDSAGTVVDLGRRRRLFSGAAASVVRQQSTQCSWTGCDHTNSRCELDHITAWNEKGHTRPGNGTTLCGRHNRLKNHGFRVWRDPEGRWHTYRPDGTEITESPASDSHST